VVAPSPDTRARILDAALECFLELGYERTTVAVIRERCGVSNGSLFHHFQSKEAIADALYVRAMASFQQGVWAVLHGRPTTLRYAVHGVIAHQLRWTEENAGLARLVYARDQLTSDSPALADLASINRELTSELNEFLTPFRERGEVRAGSVVLISAIVNGPAHALARRWLGDGLERPLESYVDELTDAAVAGLLATRQRNEVKR
jgi:AcrR family transcriptional regulator